MLAELAEQELVEIGLEAAETPLREQVKIWARHTNEKSDVAAELMTVFRQLYSVIAPEKPVKILSIGSSDEPQFRLLNAASQGGLWLYDADRQALATVNERLGRQMLDNVQLIPGDYLTDFATQERARRTKQNRLGGNRFDLITLHHSLYYCDAKEWPCLVSSIYKELLEPYGALHLVLMSSSDTRTHTTTWLYNRFAEKFFGHRNDQDLTALEPVLARAPAFDTARFTRRTNAVTFKTDDFQSFMAVVWMIMLYPDGHAYSHEQRREITEFVIEEFWNPRRPLTQVQDYLTIYNNKS